MEKEEIFTVIDMNVPGNLYVKIVVEQQEAEKMQE